LDELIYVKLDEEQTTAVLVHKPEWNKYVHEGKLYVQLLRALYGLQQSAKLWYDKINESLIALGFQANPKDPCCYNIMVDGTQATLCMHVDDMLITHVSDRGCKAVENMIRQEWKNIRVKSGNDFVFLGMEISRLKDASVQVCASAYEDKIIEGWSVCSGWKDMDKSCPTPATADLFDEEDEKDDSFLNDHDKDNYHSYTAKALYLGKRTRCDILTVISVLAGRVREPRLSDLKRLDRVYRYLNGNRNLCIVFKGNMKLCVEVYADVAFMARPGDRMSRTGCIVLVNGGVCATMSCWQKLITKSSTEAELIALTEAVAYALYFIEWLKFQRKDIPEVKIYQDNQSVLALLNSNHTGIKSTKHLQVRYFFIRQHIKSGEVVMIWCKSSDMIADILTKAVTGQLFKDMIAKILYKRWF
jgi:ribonuclease HI